jgi:hypothetical protein
MEARIIKKQTAFRLSEDLLDRLKREARNENRSLNNYVECILIDRIYREPNETTVDAIKEARAGRYAGTVDTGSMEAFLKSMEG